MSIYVESKQEMVGKSVSTHQNHHWFDYNQQQKVASSNEASLVEAAQRGSVEAFNQLVLTYQDDIFTWVASFVHDGATAEDITQLTFVAAYYKIQSFRGGSLRAWLFRIARNRCIDEIRLRQRHPSISLDGEGDDEDSTDFLSFLPADGPLPEDAVIQSERSELLKQLLEKLPEPFQQVLQLVDVYEMDYREASEVLNLPLGTLKSRLARARVKLSEMIEQNYERI